MVIRQMGDFDGITDAEAMRLLSPGVQRWVSRQGWSGFRQIQRDSIGVLLCDNGRPNVVISAATASGKALTDDMPVLTTAGWKSIATITTSDYVYGSDGMSHAVLGVFPQGMHDSYRVLLADGRYVDCNLDHIWRVIDYADDGNIKNIMTRDILQKGLSFGSKERFSIPQCSSIEESDVTNDLALRKSKKERLYFVHKTIEKYGQQCDNGDMLISGVPNSQLEYIIGYIRSLGISASDRDNAIRIYKTACSKHDHGSSNAVGIVGIVPNGKQESMTCISVDSPDHTYITKDFVVTHNTEASFMPMLSIVEQETAEHKEDHHIRAMYVAPLKALINDQYRRLADMASYCGTSVYMWHGDAPTGQKTRLMKNHDGILMTTPESLESFLMNRGEWCSNFLHPSVIVIDEFHSFLGEGRGKQLTSLIARVSTLNESHGIESPTKIALSATLSQLDLVATMLDPDSPTAIIDATQDTQDKSSLVVKCFQPALKYTDYDGDQTTDYIGMAKEIIDGSGFDKTLTFCRSREAVETVTTSINDVLGDVRQSPYDKRTAMPHHGLLSKQTREELEQRLVNTEKPTMAVATMTLELGIDIGDIARVYQVDCTNSVASLRQRMGRSGRRNGVRDMEILIPYDTDPANMQKSLLTTIAEIELMRAGWFEPPNARRKDVSVLCSEILSVITQYGSGYADELYGLLCVNGVFRNVDEELMHSVIDDMVASELLTRMDDDCLIIGPQGEIETNDWHFYATFQDQESYAVKAGNKVIGNVTPPEVALQTLANDGVFKLGGKYWQVMNLDIKGKSIEVKQTTNRGKFLTPMSSGSIEMNGNIKQVSTSLLNGKKSKYNPTYLDENGQYALNEAREYAREHRLNGLGLQVFEIGQKGSVDEKEIQRRKIAGYTDDAIVSCDPPISKAAFNAVIALMHMSDDAYYSEDYDDDTPRNGFSLDAVPLWRLAELVDSACDLAPRMIGEEDKLIDAVILQELYEAEKNNHYLSDTTLQLAYGTELIDISGAMKWMQAFKRFWNLPVRQRNGDKLTNKKKTNSDVIK